MTGIVAAIHGTFPSPHPVITDRVTRHAKTGKSWLASSSTQILINDSEAVMLNLNRGVKSITVVACLFGVGWLFRVGNDSMYSINTHFLLFFGLSFSFHFNLW